MTNYNWIYSLAVVRKKALIQMGYSLTQVMQMSLQEVEQELKNKGYDFKKNSPFKNR